MTTREGASRDVLSPASAAALELPRLLALVAETWLLGSWLPMIMMPTPLR